MYNPILSQLKNAYAFYEAGRLSQAKDAGLKVLASAASNFDALKLMGFIAGRENDYRAAAGYLAGAVRVKPDFIEGWYYLEYRELALSYARDPGKLAALRDKLRRHVDSCPLFDGALFTRNLEMLYEKMLGNYCSGAGRQRIEI